MGAPDCFEALVCSSTLGDRLDEAALLLTAHGRGEIDVDHHIELIDRLADRCPASTVDDVLTHLATEGFRGNRAAYYDPRNSWLDVVLARRLGIPISLSILTIAVGRRLGVPFVGVGLPGHFLIGTPDGERFADPFNGFIALDAAGCASFFETTLAPGRRFDATYLRPTPPVAIMARLMANLDAIYAQQNSLRQLVALRELRRLLPDAGPEHDQDLAAALAAAGQFDTAARHFDDLAHSEHRADYERRARSLRARLN